MGRTKPANDELIAGDQSDAHVATVGSNALEIRSVASCSREVLQEIRINSTPATVFALLTNAQRMTSWLAWDVEADPRCGGIFRLADFSGLWIEGAYLKVIRHRLVVFSWGGIEGLKPGQSTVEFTLQRGRNSTLVRLRHFGLSDSAMGAHQLCWEHFGLPKLKAVAEGTESGLTCLSVLADWREQHPYLARVACEDWIGDDTRRRPISDR